MIEPCGGLGLISVVETPSLLSAPGAERSPTRGSGGASVWLRRSAAVGAWGALFALLALAIGRLSQQVPLNSDQASSVLEGWAMGHGNLLLGGWTLPADGFITTKLPLLALLERFQGLTPEVVYEIAGLLGAGVVVAGAWLAGGRLRGRARVLAMLVTGALLTSQTLLMPGTGNSFPAGVMLPAGTDHAASLLLLLVACLALQAAGRSWVWPAVAWLALAVASIGDPLAAVVGGGSLTVVGAIGLATRRRARAGANTAIGGAMGSWSSSVSPRPSRSRSPGGRSGASAASPPRPCSAAGTGCPPRCPPSVTTSRWAAEPCSPSSAPT